MMHRALRERVIRLLLVLAAICTPSGSLVAQLRTDEKVTICHIPPGDPEHPKTLIVGAAAVPAHLAHGDYLGPCVPPVTLTAGGPGVDLVDPSTLVVALPIIDSGKAVAEDVVVRAVTLAGGALVNPLLPFTLGDIPAGQAVNLHLAFTGAFIPQGQYSLTVLGTFVVGTAIQSFTINVLLLVPPGAPGSAVWRPATVPSESVSGAPFPTQPLFKNPNLNTPLWTVPTGPFVSGTPTATQTSPAPITLASTLGAAPIVFYVNNSMGLPTGATNASVSTTAEPSGASTADGVIFTTANWIAAFSTDGGTTFTELDPTTVFPNDAVSFCCDQIVQYVPSIDRFIWLLQGNGYRLAVASPDDVTTSNGTAWTYWNLTPNVFGTCASFDYPDLAVGDNFLYISWDAQAPGCTAGFQVARTSLTGLQAGGTITIEFTDPANGPMAWGSHITQNTQDEVFWAGHNSNSEMRIFSAAEGSTSYFWSDLDVSSWANNAPTSTTPDGQDWLAKNFNAPAGTGGSFPRNGIIGATRAYNATASDPIIWFAWTAGTDDDFAQAHIEMVRLLRRDGDYSVLEQVQIWNDTYAFAYPALSTNACSGEVGLSFEYGGGGDYENHVVGFWGDFVAYVTTGSDVGTGRFGDYVTIRQQPPTQSDPGNLFSAFGYGLNALIPPAVGTQADIHYILFGRPAATCIIGQTLLLTTPSGAAPHK